MRSTKNYQIVFGIQDDILIVGYDADGKVNDNILSLVMQTYQKENVKLNKDKCHFRCMRVPIYSDIISRYGVQLDPKNCMCICSNMLTLTNRKELPSFLGIMNYLG